MNELAKWLDANKISYRIVEAEIVEIEGFGKMYVANTEHIQSVFKSSKEDIEFNLLENPQTLIEEDIFFVAFPFGNKWYYYDLMTEFRFNLLKYIGKRTPTAINVPFVNLGVHSPYELLNGSGDISLWIKKAKILGHGALGICDRNTMAGTLVLQKECARAGIKPVFGYSFTLKHEGNSVEMKVYCQTQAGLANLLRIQKAIMADSSDNTICIQTLLKHGGGNVLVFGKLSSEWLHGNANIVAQCRNVFEQVYYQVDLTEYKAERIDAKALFALEFYFKHFYDEAENTFQIPPVLICDNYYLDKDDAQNKIILNKIANGASHEQSDEQYFKDADEHFAVFQSIFDIEKRDVEGLFRLMCGNTLKIADNATAAYELGKMYMPQYIMRDEETKKYGTRRNMFLSLLDEALNEIIPPSKRDEYRNRLEEEVYIIESTNNLDYFLIQWDMIREAKRRGIVTGVGRGSAGGSLVSYLLGIISIDPIKYDLLFSRFLVPERCGLNWHDNVTIVGEDVWVKAGETVVELTADGQRYLFTKDAELSICRDGKEMKVRAGELAPNDEVIFDNRDRLWILEEIKQ